MFADSIKKAIAAKLRRDEDTVRRLLVSYVSEIEPAVVYGPDGEVIGLCDAHATLGSTPFVFAKK